MICRPKHLHSCLAASCSPHAGKLQQFQCETCVRCASMWQWHLGIATCFSRVFIKGARRSGWDGTVACMQHCLSYCCTRGRIHLELWPQLVISVVVTCVAASSIVPQDLGTLSKHCRAFVVGWRNASCSILSTHYYCTVYHTHVTHEVFQKMDMLMQLV